MIDKVNKTYLTIFRIEDPNWESSTRMGQRLLNSVISLDEFLDKTR